MTPREKLELLGWSSLALTALILFFSFTRSPYEWYELIAGKLSELRERLSRKKSEPGRHHIIDGPDGEDDPQVADSSSGDGTHPDGEEKAA